MEIMNLLDFHKIMKYDDCKLMYMIDTSILAGNIQREYGIAHIMDVVLFVGYEYYPLDPQLHGLDFPIIRSDNSPFVLELKEKSKKQ